MSTSLFTLGWIGGLGDGEPYPVPVEIVNVENLAMSEAESTQIAPNSISDGITKQAASEQVDDQATAGQINITTGNKCP